MTERQTISARQTILPGTVSWVDLSSPDLDAARAFYTGLFGWSAHVSPEPQAGGHTVFSIGSRQVAGASALMDPDQTPAWATFVSVASTDDAVARATGAGGQVAVGPMDVMDQGRMAFVVDPTGAAIGLWQPGVHKGADVFGVPGALSWNELVTRDLTAAIRFYAAVFGWAAGDGGSGDGGGHVDWRLDGGPPVAGATTMAPDVPPSVPAHWLPYFAVADCDLAVRRVTELGGHVRIGPVRGRGGVHAVVTDPHGASFGLIQTGG